MSADSERHMPKRWQDDPIKFLVCHRLGVIDAHLDGLLAKVVAVMQRVSEPANALESLYESYEYLLTERAKVLKRLDALLDGKPDPKLSDNVDAFNDEKLGAALAAVTEPDVSEVVE